MIVNCVLKRREQFNIGLLVSDDIPEKRNSD